MRLRLFILLVILPLAGCATSDADRLALQKAYGEYNARHLDEAEASATKFINANPTSPNLDEALYLRGISRLTSGGNIGGKGGNSKAATDDLQKAIEKSTRPDLKSKAHRALGDIDFQEGRWPEAQTHYTAALVGAPAINVSFLNYRIGACMQAQGQWGHAQIWFQRVASVQDDRALAERAIARMYATAYALQFGAFQDGAHAAELIGQLKGSGIAARAASEMSDGRLLYLVRFGSYSTWHEAETARDKLLAKFPLVKIVP